MNAEERAERARAQEYRVQSQQVPSTEADDVNGMRQEPFALEIEARLATLSEGVARQIVNQVLMDAVQLAASDSLDQCNLEAVVSGTGMSPERAMQFMQTAVTALSAP